MPTTDQICIVALATGNAVLRFELPFAAVAGDAVNFLEMDDSNRERRTGVPERTDGRAPVRFFLHALRSSLVAAANEDTLASLSTR
ncbi:MAG: hypothetical protein ABJD11_09610 [Gemmatimonadota bacterium]